jgi:hypothetical protein
VKALAMQWVCCVAWARGVMEFRRGYADGDGNGLVTRIGDFFSFCC